MKRILSILLAAVLLVSAIPAAYAAEGEHDYSNGTQITLVGTQENQGAQWTVTVPAKMQPGQTGTVKAEGTWAADQFINVHAPQSVTLTYGAQTMDVAVHFTRDWGTDRTGAVVTSCGFSQIGSNTDTVTGSATINVAEASRLFGTWEGILEYEVSLIENGDVNRDGMIAEEDATMIQNAVAKLVELTEEQKIYADLDGDGYIAGSDAIILRQVIEGKCIPAAVNAVQPVELISFTIGSTTYQAEEGMTWGEWVDSEYNTNGYVIGHDELVFDSTQTYILRCDEAQVASAFADNLIEQDLIYVHEADE